MRRILLFLATAVVLAACGGEDDAVFPDDAIAIAASTDLAVGPERLLIGVSTPSGERLGEPDAAVVFELAPLDDPGAATTVPATFTWIVPEAVGIYRASVTFDRAGPWAVVVDPADGPALDPVAFNVFEDNVTPSVGDPAPSVATPTTVDVTELDEITTDPDPDLRLYETSLDEAIASGERTVVVFSTPAYCQTAACGPMLENVKRMIAEYPAVTFIHVEVYTGLQEPDFAPDADHLAPAVAAWRLPSEPWVFVIDEAGTVAARFEGVLDPDELAAVIG